MNVNSLKTGPGIINRMRRILSTPAHQRRTKFGHGWGWEITNGQRRIREEFPKLEPAMELMFSTTGPQTVDDLEEIYP